MKNETDRDLAEQLTDLISECKTLIETINDNKFVPHITTQPVNYTGAIGDTITFTVDATNVKSYQWQFNNYPNAGSWRTSTLAGANTNTLTFEFTSVRLNYQYRCQITGLDNSVIYSDAVHLSVAQS